MPVSVRNLIRDPSLSIPFVILIVALPFFFVGGPNWMSGPLFRAVWDLGHIVFFALLLLVIQRKHPLHKWYWWLLVTLVVLIVGASIEYLQTKVGRDGNWSDVLGNLTGAWLGLFWFQRPTRWVWIGRILACLLLMRPLMIVANLALLQYQVAQKFPLISSFEQASELTRWDGRLQRSTEHISEGSYSAQVSLGKRKYSKAALRKFFGDWRQHQYLAFDIYNPDAHPLSMSLRVHDAQHEQGSKAYQNNDRFNAPLMVEPGWNKFRVALKDIQHAPEGREMEMDLIRGVEIFTGPQDPPRVIYLDNLRLQ